MFQHNLTDGFSGSKLGENAFARILKDLWEAVDMDPTGISLNSFRYLKADVLFKRMGLEKSITSADERALGPPD